MKLVILEKNSLQQLAGMLYWKGMSKPIFGRWRLRPFTEYHVLSGDYKIDGGHFHVIKRKERNDY